MGHWPLSISRAHPNRPCAPQHHKVDIGPHARTSAQLSSHSYRAFAGGCSKSCRLRSPHSQHHVEAELFLIPAMREAALVCRRPRTLALGSGFARREFGCSEKTTAAVQTFLQIWPWGLSCIL